MAGDSRGDRSGGPAPAAGTRGNAREPGVSAGGDQTPPEAGHEKSDVSISGIVKFAIGLAIVAGLVHVGLWGLLRFFEAREAKRDQPVPPMVAASLRRTPREPRLERDPLAPRIAAQSREDAILASYGWVDRNAGIARIPIDRAMELLVERGLPAPKPVMPAVTPGALSPKPAPPAPQPNPRPAGGEREKAAPNR